VIVQVDLVRIGCLGIEILDQLRDRRAGVITFASELRQADENRILFRLAVLLDRRVGQIGAQLVHRNLVLELQDDVRRRRRSRCPS